MTWHFFHCQPRLVWIAVLATAVTLFAGSLRADSLVSVAQQHEKLVKWGHAALEVGQAPKAADYFAQALRLAPTDATTQLAMAEAFARRGQVRKAEAFLRHLLREAVQSANTQLYLRALSQLQKRYPFVVSGSFALLPSTNIDNAPSQSNFQTLLGRFEIDKGGEQTSGIGLELGAEGKYRRPLTEGLSFELGAALNYVWYDKPSLRYWRGRVTADVARLTASNEVRGGLHIDQITYPLVAEKSSDRLAKGAHITWSHAMGNGVWLGLRALAEYRKYSDKQALSGPYATIGVSWLIRQKSGARLLFSGSLERSKPELDYHRYLGGTVRAGYERNLLDTLRAGISAHATLRVYDSEFAAVEYARRDDIYRVGLSVSDSRLKVFGATPKLTCSYREQNSNISLYTMASTDCRIGWEFRF